LAEELEISKRTIYRDIADLMGQRVPIEGEAGLSYLLASDYDMSPLMLTFDQIEAAVLGAQWVGSRADRILSTAARDAVAKITVDLRSQAGNGPLDQSQESGVACPRNRLATRCRTLGGGGSQENANWLRGQDLNLRGRLRAQR
jgi:predicted DNA-binding transcriptional regulator YafY